MSRPAVYLSIPPPDYMDIWFKRLKKYLPDQASCVYIRLSDSFDPRLLENTLNQLDRLSDLGPIMVECGVDSIPASCDKLNRLILRVQDPADIPNIDTIPLSLEMTVTDITPWQAVDWPRFFSVALYPNALKIGDLEIIQHQLYQAGLARQDAYSFGMPGDYMPHVWQAKTIIGIGPGAYSAGWEYGKRWRSKNADDLNNWATARGDKHILDQSERRFEICQNSLAHVDGINNNWLMDIYGMTLDRVIDPEIRDQLVADGLAKTKNAGNGFQLTTTGLNQFEGILRRCG
jgi:hypothetical protein